MSRRFIVTPRDKTLLLLLHSYGLLRTHQVAERVFPGIALTTMLRRLRKLEEAGLIARVPGLPNGGFAWRVTERGARFVTESSPKKNFGRHLLDHDLVITDIRFSLEGNGIARSWVPEHEIRARVAAKYGTSFLSERTIPDGLMTVEYKGYLATVAFEVELHQKNKDRYRRAFRSYSQKRNVLAVWYLVPSTRLGRLLSSLWPGTQPYFLWSVLDDVLGDPGAALLHHGKNSFPLKSVWAPAGTPAHPAAQEMSTTSNSVQAHQTDIST